MGGGYSEWRRKLTTMPIAAYIKKRESAKTLHSVTYADIRDNCGQNEDVQDVREIHLWKWMKHQYVEDWKETIQDIKWKDVYGRFDWHRLLRSSVFSNNVYFFYVDYCSPLYAFSSCFGVLSISDCRFLCYYDLWNEMAV